MFSVKVLFYNDGVETREGSRSRLYRHLRTLRRKDMIFTFTPLNENELSRPRIESQVIALGFATENQDYEAKQEKVRRIISLDLTPRKRRKVKELAREGKQFGTKKRCKPSKK